MSTINVSPSATTNYIVTVTDANGCINSAQLTLNVTPLPVATLSSSDSDNNICAGEEVTLTVSGTGTFMWNGGSNSNSIIVKPTATTTYSVTVTNNGCNRVLSQIITVNPLPTINLESINCSADQTMWSINVSSTNATTIGASAGSVTGSGPSFTISEIPISMNCILTASNMSTGCSAPLTVNAPDCNCTMVQAPTGLNKNICLGEAIPDLVVMATTGLTVDWYDSASGGVLLLANSLTYKPPVTAIGSYTYFAESKETSSGCVSATRTPITLAINGLPMASISSDEMDNTICDGEDIVLTGNGGVNYSWSSGASSAMVTLMPNATTNYTVTVTDDKSCSSTSMYEVTVNPKPDAAIVSSSGSFALCTGGSLNLSVPAGNSYSWSNGSATNLITINPNAATSYSVLVTDANGCTNSSSQEVTINPKPAINVLIPSLICSGSDFLLIENGGVASSWNWNVNASVDNMGDSILIKAGTLTNNNLSLTVTDMNGCTSSQSLMLTVVQSPVFNAEFLVANKACVGDTVKMLEHSVLDFVPTKVVWDFGDGESSNELYPIHVYKAEGEFKVSVNIFSGDCSVKSIVKSIVVEDCKSNYIGGDHYVKVSSAPNPKSANSPTFIVFESQTIQPIEYYLSNAQGQIVSNGLKENKQNYSIRIDDLKAGVYFVVARWLYSKQKRQYKIVIIN